jgi:hypothetical protein
LYSVAASTSATNFLKGALSKENENKLSFDCALQAREVKSDNTKRACFISFC